MLLIGNFSAHSYSTWNNAVGNALEVLTCRPFLSKTTCMRCPCVCLLIYCSSETQPLIFRPLVSACEYSKPNLCPATAD